MLISEHWLREWVADTGPTEQLAHRLTMAGLEVDGVEPAAPAFSGVVVGRITRCEPHPDADKLRLCQVDAGQGEPLQVVCGAPNAREGLVAPLATVGGELPGGLKIKRAKLRGQASFGMLCSARELGLSEDADGLMELPEDAPVGRDLRDYLGLADNVIEVDLTPNRADCLGMIGVAREVGALLEQPVQTPDIPAVPAALEDTVEVQLDAPEACARYLGRVVRGLNPRAETPLWMRERLRRAGIRSLGPLVDVTNYVLIELGQPMHAFDLARVEGTIHARWARPGETLTLIGGETIELASDQLVIADDQQALALAGIMGGEDSSVGDDTRDILLECAWFAPAAIAGRARAHGLHTDSSHRFERGVDPAGQHRAMARASQLLLSICGGEAGPVKEAVAESHLPAREAVRLRGARVARVLGADIPGDRIIGMLERLGMRVTPEADGVWQVDPPSWRFDIAREEDLIEEVARLYGYDQLPTRRPPIPLTVGRAPEEQTSLSRLRQVLVQRGYHEAITYSFVAPETQRTLDPEHEALPLANPISADLAVMRTSLWPGLVQAARHNQNRQVQRIRLFESGLRFIGAMGHLRQEPRLAGLALGPGNPEQWGEPGRALDFYDVKGDVEALLAAGGRGAEFRFQPDRHPALHPGQTARILDGGQPIGWLGALHPAQARELDIQGPVFLFDLDLAAVQTAALPAFRPLSRYPANRRDLALLVAHDVPAQQLVDAALGAGGEQLVDVRLFDVYAGKGVPEGQKSVAMGLILQDSSRTLTDEDMDRVLGRVVERLGQETGAVLRGE
ncbi:phenylalanyl-tRNA synthetase beta subunit [Alkalispirillum mobile]|uniref:Phenylalanine--tRNA ligase beta subunit n=1 Tax=Alkalispirillum mobile TaxID=85925 RepID=A0A498CEU9_9GAMM|nr:phenylalanine--tRNA ligase subunit beta [Alkalispirillum mobile]RLK50948.1 phenylalanyl-tRNA synthetase beta subunit [Alkalispirillum mobile]